MNEKEKKTYTLDTGTLDLKPGDQVRLKGKRTKSGTGAPEFAATKLVKDYGPCDPQAALKVPTTP